MSLFNCTGKNKKKYHKFGIVEVFRAKMPSKPEKVLEIQQVNKYAEELASKAPAL